MRRTLGVAFLALLTACGGSTTTPEASPATAAPDTPATAAPDTPATVGTPTAPTSTSIAPTTTTAPTTTAPASTTTTTTVPTTTTTTVASTTTVAAADVKYVVAGGRTRGADEDFDDRYLNVFGFSMFDSADDPNLVPVSQATWLAPNDVVLGVVQGDDAVAFPIQQMAYHHIANVRIAGEPWLVTY